jgi:hypothetical protein
MAHVRRAECGVSVWLGVLSWHPERIAFGVFSKEIDEHLKRVLTGPDAERDRMIFWLYVRKGMSTKEIASLPTIGLGAKGVGTVVRRFPSPLNVHPNFGFSLAWFRYFPS